MKINSEEIAWKIISCFKHGHILYACGNGGSSAMSSHFCAEFMCKFEKERRPLPAISLTTDTSFLTAMGNDYEKGMEGIFVRQISALGKSGDVLVVFSTSGKSKNCLLAIEEAKLRGMEVIDFPREGKNTAEIQEFQLHLMHSVVREVEKEFI